MPHVHRSTPMLLDQGSDLGLALARGSHEMHTAIHVAQDGAPEGGIDRDHDRVLSHLEQTEARPDRCADCFLVWRWRQCVGGQGCPWGHGDILDGPMRADGSPCMEI